MELPIPAVAVAEYNRNIKALEVGVVQVLF
jgi:hypothetical protein